MQDLSEDTFSNVHMKREKLEVPSNVLFDIKCIILKYQSYLDDQTLLTYFKVLLLLEVKH
jgi:hypothetical protein